MTTPLCAKIAGFSLHAARSVHAQDRDALERLCRYGLRAPFSQERLTLRDDGSVVYRLRRPWPNPAGANCLILEPNEFLRRLAALIPAPYTNLVRYHGVFAGRSSAYAHLPKPPTRVPRPGERPTHDAQPPAVPMTSTALPAESTPVASPRNRHRRSTWAQLLRRVFFLDALTCQRCDTGMVVLALLSDPAVVRKILLHLELPADLPTPVAGCHRSRRRLRTLRPRPLAAHHQAAAMTTARHFMPGAQPTSALRRMRSTHTNARVLDPT